MEAKVFKYLLGAILVSTQFVSKAQNTVNVKPDEEPPPYEYGKGFIGGSDKYHEFIKKNLAKNVSRAYRQKSNVNTDYVRIDVYIDSVGHPFNYKIAGIDNCPQCNKEALRVIKLVKKWMPPKKYYSEERKEFVYLPFFYSERVDF